MKAFLMYKDRDFGVKERLQPRIADLTQDLELDTLFRAMANADEFLSQLVKTAVLASLHEPEEIRYRQQVLADCLEHPDVVREIYGTAVEAIERERKVWGWMSARYPEGTLHRSVEVLQIFVELLKRLKHIAVEHGNRFRSPGFTRFFQMLLDELSDEYMRSVEDHLVRLRFRNGVLMSAELDKGNKGKDYVLRRLPDVKQGWMERLQSWMEHVVQKDTSSYVYEVADRDETGFQALSELRSRAIGHVAAALAQSTDHILSFFSMLRSELGFYVSGLNLRDRLATMGEPICFPDSLPTGTPALTGQGLYDVCLCLSMQEKVVGNDVAADRKTLVMITGANRGGKSTFLRSIGLAQLMMQCGMFVPAASFRANICQFVLTHFKREEDATMKSGKLDEELSRMSSIVDKVRPDTLILFNESFASTNEREGSEIARQIVRALLENNVKVFYVTHLFDLAQGFHRTNPDPALFLRAERLPDGRRTFQLIEGAPLPTSYGADLYRRIFEPAPGAADAARSEVNR